jgi:hypothetical protein
MSQPTFAHRLKPENFAPTQDDEVPEPDEGQPEVRTLDGWLESFFGNRDSDFEILYTRLALAVAHATDSVIEEGMIQHLNSDDMDSMTCDLTQDIMHLIWHGHVLAH